MPCSPKVAIGGPSGLALVFSFIIVILGIVIMTSTIPETKCGTRGQYGINASDKSSVDTALMFITWPLLLGGLLGLVGSALGIFGGLKASKCGVCSAAVLLGIASVFVIIGSLAAMTFAAIFSEMCDNYMCGSASTCSESFMSAATCSQPGVCCHTNCMMVQCKETNDWACDIVGKKSGGMVVGYLGFIIILITAGLTCAGGCCCPAKFDGLDAAKSQGGAVPAVIGQPVS